MSDQWFTCVIDVRFRDLDTMGHVNNAIYATYLEEARSAYYRDVVGVALPDVGTVLAHLSIDYESSIDVSDEVSVRMRVSELGESSIRMEYIVLADGGSAATAKTVQVCFDRELGESRPIPTEWRKRIQAQESR